MYRVAKEIWIVPATIAWPVGVLCGACAR